MLEELKIKTTQGLNILFLGVTAQVTPPSSHRVRTIRRQSSIDAHQQSSAPPPAPTVATTSHAHSTAPLSSSTSYYTNSPSPPVPQNEQPHGDEVTN